MPPSAAASRDPVLDLWRGLALLDMVLVHLTWNGIGLPEPLDTTLKHYTRFAAGGFVLVAGLTIGTVFGARTSAAGPARRASCRWLWRRALLLLVIDRLASVAMAALDRYRLFATSPVEPLGLLDVLLFRAPGTTGGLLVLYTLLLALSPLLLTLIRRLGPLAVVVASLAAYAAVDRAGGAWHWPPWSFPLASWQPLYVAGVVGAPALPWIRRGGLGRSAAWLTVSLGCFVPVFLARFGRDFGLGWFAERAQLDFTKEPLRIGGLAWYLTASQLALAGSLVAWELLPRRLGVLAWLTRLGRNSLAVYVAHLFTAVPVVDLVWGAWPSAGVRSALAVVDVVALVALARWIERGRVTEASARRARPMWSPRPVFAVSVAVATSTVATLAVGHVLRARVRVVESAPPTSVGQGRPTVEVVEAPGESRAAVVPLPAEVEARAPDAI